MMRRAILAFNGLLALSTLTFTVPPAQAEVIARRIAGVGPEWVALSVGCVFRGPCPDDVIAADILFECRGTGRTRQHRTIAVDFLRDQVDFDFVLDA